MNDASSPIFTVLCRVAHSFLDIEILMHTAFLSYRQVFHDGLKNKVETRHSVSLCLLFCPIGIATHAITKMLRERTNDSH